MKKILKSIFKLNLLLCAGALILDMYEKTCDTHKKVNATLDALQKSNEQ